MQTPLQAGTPGHRRRRPNRPVVLARPAAGRSLTAPRSAPRPLAKCITARTAGTASASPGCSASSRDRIAVAATAAAYTPRPRRAGEHDPRTGHGERRVEDQRRREQVRSAQCVRVPVGGAEARLSVGLILAPQAPERVTRHVVSCHLRDADQPLAIAQEAARQLRILVRRGASVPAPVLEQGFARPHSGEHAGIELELSRGLPIDPSPFAGAAPAEG